MCRYDACCPLFASNVSGFVGCFGCHMPAWRLSSVRTCGRIKQFPLLLSGQRAHVWVGLMCTCTSVVQLQLNGGNHSILMCRRNVLSESLNQLAWSICAAASANWWTDPGSDQKQGLSYTFTRQRKIRASFAIRPIGVSIRRCTRLDKCDVEGFKRDLGRFEDCK